MSGRAITPLFSALLQRMSCSLARSAHTSFPRTLGPFFENKPFPATLDFDFVNVNHFSIHISELTPLEK